jgi:hypothetical protein
MNFSKDDVENEYNSADWETYADWVASRAINANYIPPTLRPLPNDMHVEMHRITSCRCILDFGNNIC